MLTLTEDKLIQIFVAADDFMKEFEPQLQRHSLGVATRSTSKLYTSEILTLSIAYHFSRMACFKAYYHQIVLKQLKPYFPHLPSYARFIALKRQHLLATFAFLQSRLHPASPQANYIDSKKLESCHYQRAGSHRTMKGLANKGKTSTGWFYGLKLHLIINAQAELCQVAFSSGNVSDNNANLLKTLFKRLQGVFFGDKGYLTKLKDWLAAQGVQLITKVRKNMTPKNRLNPQEKHYLHHRGLIETVFGLLTFQANIDHTRHRSQVGMFINLISGLIAYTFFDVLPRLKPFTHPKQIELFKDLIP